MQESMKHKYPNQARLLKAIRKKAGLSQKEMASLMGFDSPQFVSNIERGVAPIPARRCRQLSALVTKEALFKAWSKDNRLNWITEYGRN